MKQVNQFGARSMQDAEPVREELNLLELIEVKDSEYLDERDGSVGEAIGRFLETEKCIEGNGAQVKENRKSEFVAPEARVNNESVESPRGASMELSTRSPSARPIEAEEKKSRGEIEAAGAHNDNRNFLMILLGGDKYRALLDPGSMITIAGPNIAKRFPARITPDGTLIRSVTGDLSRVLGALEVQMEVDGIVKRVHLKVVAELEQDIILDMNFCREL